MSDRSSLSPDVPRRTPDPKPPTPPGCVGSAEVAPVLLSSKDTQNRARAWPEAISSQNNFPFTFILGECISLDGRGSPASSGRHVRSFPFISNPSRSLAESANVQKSVFGYANT